MTRAAHNPANPDAEVTVIRISPDGQVQQEVWHRQGDGALLLQLQAAVDGLVDVVALGEQLDMWINDEGLYTGEVNPVATLVAAAHGRDTQPYYGPAVFTGGADADGTTMSLPADVATGLLATARQAQADEATRASVTAWAERFANPYRV